MPRQQQGERYEQSFTLIFTDRSLEARYMEYRIAEGYAEDRWFAVFHLAAFVLHQVVSWIIPWKVPRPYHWSIYAYAAVLILHVMVTSSMPRGTYLTHRNRIAFTVKSCLMLLYFLNPSESFYKLGVISTPAGFWKRCLRLTGILVYGFMALVVRLPLHLHVYLQAAFLVFFVWLNNEDVCNHFYKGRENVSCLPGSGEFCQHTVGKFVMGQFLEVFGFMSFFHSQLTAPGHNLVVAQDPKVLCHTVITFLQMLLGFVAPTLLVYAFDQRSRTFFLQHYVRDPDYLMAQGVNRQYRRRNPTFEVCYQLIVGTSQFLALVYLMWELALLNQLRVYLQ